MLTLLSSQSALCFRCCIYRAWAENRYQDHTLFHETPLSQQELDDGYTRPYRWHMDTPFYERLPGKVTILHAVKAPKLPDQRLKFPDGKEKEIAAGATACESRLNHLSSPKRCANIHLSSLVFSGARVFEMLTPEEQEFALNTTVTYAPQAYEYIRNCKATEDGLSIPHVGNEVPIDQVSSWSWDKVAEHPVRFCSGKLRASHKSHPHRLCK